MDTAVIEPEAVEGEMKMSLMKSELKIMGVNPVLLSAAITAAFILLSVSAGELLDLSCIGFEVIFPFFAAIAVGEWGKIRADENFDMIAAQGRSVFRWMAARFTAVFFTVSLFAAIGMIPVGFIRQEMPLWEMSLTYFSPAFFLGTLSMLLNLCLTGEHISTLICGTVGLVTIILRALLRFPGVEYVYLFIRFAGDKNGIWPVNKAILLLLGLAMWGVAFLLSENMLKFS